MRWLRRWLHPETPPPGFRGTFCAPEVGLPEGFALPSAALVPRGMQVDPAQLPRDLKEPATQPGQPPSIPAPASLAGIPVVTLPGLPGDIAVLITPGRDPVVIRIDGPG